MIRTRAVLSIAALSAMTLPLAAESISVMSWGGAYSKSQLEAYNKPFTAATGITVDMLDSDNPATPLRAMVEAKNVTIDVADVEYPDAVRLCDEGLSDPIDPAIRPAAPDVTPATDDFLPSGLADCAVGSIVFSTIYAYDETKFTDPPTTIADFFDTAKFPGKRGVKRTAKAILEMALMGDGVAPDQVYEVLSTPEGVDRAFAKLDTIKGDIVWWEAGAQPPQLLSDGEVAMTIAYNGRIFAAAVTEGKPFKMVWDGQVYEYNLFVIPKGAPNKANAEKYIAFATGTQPLADQTKWISYGPARKSSMALVGLYEDGKTEMAPNLPTAEGNMTKALASSNEFWVDHEAELFERFNAWLASN